MPGPAFDPNGAVRFDMKTGAASDTRGTRLVLVPASALEALDRTTPGALAHIGAEVGRGCGARVAARLGGDAAVRSSTLEVVVTHLAGELAIAGLGAVHLERWGKAMVIVVTNPGVNSDGFLGAVLAGAIGAATGREVAIQSLGRDGSARSAEGSESSSDSARQRVNERVRYFVGAQPTALKARSLLSQGKSWGEILSILQKASA